METYLATGKDAALLAALHAESFGAARWSLAQIADSVALATTEAWVADEGGVLQGFILCQLAGDEAEILTFCVSPAARRKGAGRRLLDAALAAAKKKGIRRVFLEVAADNQAALTLYEKTGFRLNGKRAGYYARDGKAVDAMMLGFDL
jgi:ribosomal-protein-alanine N-acetyltransferase